MVFYAVLAAVQLREQPRQKLSERAPKSGAILRRRRRAFPESVLALLSRRRREVSRFRNPHFSIDQHWSGAAPIRENTHREPCAATSGITNFSRLPAAQSFAAPNLNTLHFTPLTGGPQRKHERPADRSRPKAGQRQRSRALAVAGARRRPGAPRQRGRLPVPARADQATDARAVLLRRPLSPPATVLLLLRVRSASASGVGTKQGSSPRSLRPAADAIDATSHRSPTRRPRIVDELESRGRKVTHWAWWAFPTDLCGASEPPPETKVSSPAAAAELLARGPVDRWRRVLELVCDLSERRGELVRARVIGS